MPLSVLMPAPVSTTTRSASSIQARARATSSSSTAGVGAASVSRSTLDRLAETWKTLKHHERLPRRARHRRREAHRPMHARDIPSDIESLRVTPWSEPVIDRVGHDPRTVYVERFWLGILGPSATWLLRLLVDRLDVEPEGYDLDLDECARSLCLGRRLGPNGAFTRTLARCCQFGAARFL